MSDSDVIRSQIKTVYPVILPVPERIRRLTPGERVRFLSQYARSALIESAGRSRVPVPTMEKDANGAPKPCNGYYWSLTHKPEYVGAIIAPSRIGIDLEKIKDIPASVMRRIANDTEWGLQETDRLELFFRFWTAKEAVLKAVGIGFRDLVKCRIASIPDSRHVTLEYRERQWWVEHIRFNGHIASIVRNDFHVKWILPDASPA